MEEAIIYMQCTHKTENFDEWTWAWNMKEDWKKSNSVSAKVTFNVYSALVFYSSIVVVLRAKKFSLVSNDFHTILHGCRRK